MTSHRAARSHDSASGLNAERAALLSIYLLALVAAILLVDAGESSGVAIALWWIASVALGWRTKAPLLGLLALLAIPLAIPFGYADEYTGSEAPWVPLFAIVAGAISGLLVVLSSIVASIMGQRRH